AVLGLAACSGGGGSEHAAALVAAPVAADPTVTSAPPVDDTTTTAPPPTTAAAPTVPPPPPPGLGPGDEGPAVLTLEQRLNSLHYEVGPVDSVYDADTAYGVMAFQKVTGLERSGRATDDVVGALATATPPPPLVPDGGANRVEVDMNRQVLFLYEGGSLLKVLPVSTGSGERFCSEGYCRNAVTPQGSFAIYEQRQGWETSPLGRLYNSQYFDGGFAIHGSPSVPAEPASHGCVRIPMSAAEWFPSHVSVGTPVYIAGDEGVPAARAPGPPPPTDPAAGVSAGSSGAGSGPPPMTYVPPVATTAAPTTTTTRPLLGLLSPPPHG
ncbi:MAG: L,D-transpeptidase family protein, partial [Actinomycetota bacterium]|nr:L,D-transpeptidase family protein [Actinomycetota bacterium]